MAYGQNAPSCDSIKGLNHTHIWQAKIRAKLF